MRLKRLELLGFKSFADRVLLDFSAPVIGIVGPNGCGKSNVVDAVRWVLGEQRPTSMRGGEMSDVIFKGSASRPALSVAEATVVLDNSEGALPGRGSEVSVTRRVYKSGEGEYLIDGQTVRLRDVREMLYGTGLGSRGYSVLEQGKIDAILSANPLERRAIFEEAAGISRYRARRKETESRLERVLADCLRLDDVLGELERRKRSLKLQAGRAQRYLEARTAWQVQGRRLVCHQLGALELELARLAERLEELGGEVESLRARRAGAEGDIAAREAEQESLMRGIERLAGASAEAGAELRALDERRAELGERAESARASAGEEEARAAELERRLLARAEETRVLEQDIERLEDGTRSARERALLLAEEVLGLDEELSRLAGAHEAQSAVVLRLLHRRTGDQNQLANLERARGLLGERLGRAQGRCAEIEAQIGGVRAEEETRLEELRELEERLAELQREHAAAEGETRGLETARSELEARRNALEIEIARLSSRVEALRDREEERAGLETGARELLRACERGDGPELVATLAGLLADHLHPDSATSRALDAALGARAGALVARSAEEARSILDWLKERASGRVSLVLPGGLAAPEPGVPRAEEIAAEAGVVGSLIELARPDRGYETLVRCLFGRDWLVEDLGQALRLVARHPLARFVTREGDLVDAGGVSGGHQEVTHGPLGRRSFAAELEAQRRAEEEQRVRLDAELFELGVRRDERAGSLRELGLAQERALERRGGSRSALEALRARLEELERARELALAERAERLDEGARIEAELSEIRGRASRCEEELRAEHGRLDALEQERAGKEADREQKKQEETHARVEASGLGERLEAHRRELLQRARLDEEAREELARARRLVLEHEGQAVQASSAAGELLAERDRLLERRGRLEEEITVLREREREGRRALEELRQLREGLTAELERGMAALGERRLERQRAELAREEHLRRGLEDFGLGAAELLEGAVPDPELADPARLEALGSEVRGLRASLEELGPVNVEAVDELREIEERHGFLDAQRRDLEDARRSLEGSVRRLEEESERLFLASFEEIRGHFRGIFRQLFGGGRAEVSLIEGGSVLEAGIEVMARPPGREVLPISLLSGGQRTLTALAILFAVFRAHPSPFCILDEVDAALDDANIGRFLSLLRESLDGTQFVVVTHNKGTMSACQMLYGVTMAVRGVSHVVSVELAEVDEIAPARREEKTEQGSSPRASGGAPAEPDRGGGNGRATGSGDVPPAELVASGEPS